ncbi:MAG: single-stranded-DNA-specific exonuclease RecJ [Alphaproteobacteria bacterium]
MSKLNQVQIKNNNSSKYISLKGIHWSEKSNDDEEKSINDIIDIDPILLKLLISRKVNQGQFENFINPKLKNLLPDPDIVHDMCKATEKIYEYILSGRKIGVFGDYDVDGSTATAIVCKYFKEIGVDFEFYIPDRVEEGYGPNLKAFEYLKNKSCSLIITLDCGTTSNEVISKIKKQNVEVIVIDHHLQGVTLPDAFAIVNPNKNVDKSGLENLCAAGVSFFLIISLNRKLKKLNFFSNNTAPNLLKFLDLVALGTICDLVKLDLVNRTLVKQGIKVINKKTNLGLKSLIEKSSIDEEVNEYHLGFILGPRINAAGRVGKSNLGANLLISDREDINTDIAEKLDTYNSLRKSIENNVQIQAKNQVDLSSKDIICVNSENWHPGVIGIVAGKLTEEFNRPSIVIAENEKCCKASCRSVKNFHIGNFIIKAIKDGYLESGGGHEMAGGFSIKKNKIDHFKNYLKNKFQVTKEHYERKYDLEIKLSSINNSLYHNIDKLSPFGMGNPKPKFLIKGCIKSFVKPAGDKHLITYVKDIYGNSVKSIIFNCYSNKIGNFIEKDANQIFDMICTIKINKWGGSENIELVVEDIIDDQSTIRI